MKRNLWRLAVALIMSASCFLGTAYWYESSKHSAYAGDRKPMARLSESTNEVQRKPLSRVIWENINRNDELFAGEAVRTSPNAEAKLFFVKTGTVIVLEPDSLVVLEENAQGLSLDFLQGNLFVQQGSGGANTSDGEGLTVKTGSGEIKLQSAAGTEKTSLTLSRDQSGQVNLEMFEGQAQLQQGSKTVALEKDRAAVLTEDGVNTVKDRLQIVTPQAGQTVLLNLVRGERFQPSWEPLPVGYTVTAEVGKSRSSLSKVNGIEAHGEKGNLNFRQKPGKWYLRLVAKSSNPALPTLTSLVTPFEVQPKTPPALLEPKPETAVLKKDPQEEVAFSWLNRHKFESQVLEIAADPQFKTVITRKNLESGDNSISLPLNDGTHFWRVTGFLKINDKSEALSSAPARFIVNSSWEIKPAKLLLPANKATISFAQSQKNGVTFKWEPSLGAKGYELVVQKQVGEEWKPVFEKQTEANLSKAGNVRPGVYRWHVVSLDPKDGKGQVSEHFQFRVEDMPKIEWVQAEPEVEFEFATPTPGLIAKWKPLPTPPAAYRYRVVQEGQPLNDSAWQSTKQTLFDISLSSEGKYEAVVEAVDAKEQTIAQSEAKIFHIKRRPLLPPPQWLAETPEILKSDARGNLTFGWEQVEGADHYLLIIENKDGKLLEQKQVSRTTASVNRLKPGQYKVRLKTVDGLKRTSSDSEEKKIEVPNTSDIKAPKIKAMKVK